MLFMVIERFKNGDPRPVGERFRLRGRMMPEGVEYVSSWVQETGTTCYQVMEAAERALLEQWIGCWDDLVDFEVVPVLASADFWAKQRAG